MQNKGIVYLCIGENGRLNVVTFLMTNGLSSCQNSGSFSLAVVNVPEHPLVLSLVNLHRTTE
jgi:hypothetical protein